MFRILVLSLLVCACEVGIVEGSHRSGLGTAAVAPLPSPQCPGGYSEITAHQAAKNIASAYCASLEQDYDALCMAPVVARFCPDIAACQVNLCLDLMDTYAACTTQFPPSPDCAVLFPAHPSRIVRRTLVVPSSAALQVGGGTAVMNGTFWIVGTSTHPIYFPVALDVGCRIHDWAIRGAKITDQSQPVIGDLGYDELGQTVNVGGSKYVTERGWFALGSTGIDHTIGAGRQYFARFFGSGALGAYGTSDGVTALDLTYSCP